MTVVCTIISNTAVVLRLAARYFLGQAMGGDDWTILAAVVSSAIASPNSLKLIFGQITDAIFVYYGIQSM